MTFALDNNNIFCYKQNKGNDTNRPYVNSYVTVFHYDKNTQENQKQGQFIIAIALSNGVATVTIYKAGAAPLLKFTLTKKINWDYKNLVYCYINDQRNDQWLLQFNDAQSAAQATAAVSMLLNIQSTNEVGCYETASLNKRGKSIGIGDKVMLSYFAFTVPKFPYVGKLVSSNIKFSTILSRDKIPTGWVSGMLGMFCGNSRTIFVPAKYTCMEDGSRDQQFPNENLIIVTCLLKTKINSDPRRMSDVSDLDLKKIPKPSQIDEESSEQVIQKPQQQTIEQPVKEEPSANTVNEKEQKEIVKEDDEKKQKLSKIMKFAMPIMPKPITPKLNEENQKKQEDISLKPINSIKTPVMQKSTVDEKLCKLEKDISEKLNLFNNNTFCNFASLLYQIKIKDDEINEIKKEITSAKLSKVISNTNDSFKQIEQIRKDTEKLMNQNAQIEKIIQENESRIKSLQANIKVNEEKAKTATKSIIKSMMSDVFEDMNEMFDENIKYTGEDVSKQLYNMLRKHSFSYFNEIEKNGLF